MNAMRNWNCSSKTVRTVRSYRSPEIVISLIPSNSDFLNTPSVSGDMLSPLRGSVVHGVPRCVSWKIFPLNPSDLLGRAITLAVRKQASIRATSPKIAPLSINVNHHKEKRQTNLFKILSQYLFIAKQWILSERYLENFLSQSDLGLRIAQYAHGAPIYNGAYKWLYNWARKQHQPDSDACISRHQHLYLQIQYDSTHLACRNRSSWSSAEQ